MPVEYGVEQGGGVGAAQADGGCTAPPVVEFVLDRTVDKGVAECAEYEGALAPAALDEAGLFEEPIGLLYSVGVDCRALHYLSGGGELVADQQQAQAQGLLGLLDELHVGGDAAVPVDAIHEARALHVKPTFTSNIVKELSGPRCTQVNVTAVTSRPGEVTKGYRVACARCDDSRGWERPVSNSAEWARSARRELAAMALWVS